MKKKTKNRSSPIKRVMIAVAVIFVAGLPLILISQTVMNRATKLRGERNASVLHSVADAYQTQVPTYDQLRRTKINLLLDSGVIQSHEPNHSSKVNVCYIAKDYASVISVRNIYQTCYIRYVDLFKTTMSRKLIVNSIQDIDHSEEIFGTNYTLEPKTCDLLFDLNSTSILTYLHQSLTLSEKNEEWCKIPDPIVGIMSHNHQLSFDRMVDHESERTLTPSDVDPSVAYLVMESEHNYYREDSVSVERVKPIVDF